MKKTKIQTITKSKTIDYSMADVQNFWLKLSHDHQKIENNNKNELIQCLKSRQDCCICIQSERIDDSDIIKEIFEAAKRRNRIYVLTNKEPSECKDLEGVCLIRYGINIFGSCILVNPNSSDSNADGVFFSAALTKESLAIQEYILITLDNAQIKTLFRFFSYNFWNKATHEIIDFFNNPQQTEEPPLDILPNIDDFCDRKYVDQQLKNYDSTVQLSIPNIIPDKMFRADNVQGHEIEIHCSLNNNNHEMLCQLSRNNNTIYASKTFNVNYFLLGPEKSWLIPNKTVVEDDQFFAIPLNTMQKNQLEELYREQKKSADYKFVSDSHRSDLTDKSIRLLTDDCEVTIKAFSAIKAKSINCQQLFDKDVFESQEPSFNDDHISCKIEYTWKIHPYILPNNAKKAQIYKDWQKFEKLYSNYCNEINVLIDKTKNRSVVEKLKRYILGKKQTLSRMKEDLHELQNIKLSDQESLQCKKILSRINELRNELNANMKEIDVTIEINNIDEEIQEIISTKEEKEKHLGEYIKKQKQLQNEKQKQQQEKLNAIREENEIKNFLEKHQLDKESLSQLKHELKKFTYKDQKKKYPEDSKIAQELINKMKKIETETVDFRKRFEADQNKVEKEIKRLDLEIEKKKKQRNKIGLDDTQNQSSSSLNELVGSKNQSSQNKNKMLTLPKNLLQLPKVGELYEQGKQKYLAIEYWEDYETGKQEIERFNAILCAKK